MQTKEIIAFFIGDSASFQLLSDVGIQTDLIPVGREVAGVILQGQKQTNRKIMGNCYLILFIICIFLSTVGDKVSFFQPDDEVVGRFNVGLKGFHTD